MVAESAGLPAPFRATALLPTTTATVLAAVTVSVFREICDHSVQTYPDQHAMGIQSSKTTNYYSRQIIDAQLE